MRLRILWLILCALPLLAQPWEAVQALKPGDKVRVLEVSGHEHRGTLVSATASSVSVKTGDGTPTIDRTLVRRVQVRSGARRARRVVIFAGIGLALGLVVDQTAGTYLRNETGESSGARAATYLAPTGLLGAIAGAFPAYQTVYKSR